MIVASHPQGWKIINQRSHGLLAAMIAYQYDIDLPNEVIVPVLIAIAEHDDGVAETTEDKNLTEAGAPRHFLVPAESDAVDLEQYQNIMEIATSKCQLNALLTSMHINFILGDKSQIKNKHFIKFLKDQKINRQQIIRSLKFDKKYADRLYRFVEWCDAFSLLICMDKIQPEGRKMEISESPDGQMNQTFYKDENTISVEPWVFKNDSFTVFYEYKIIEQLQFKSIEEFNLICQKAPVHRHEFMIQK